VRWNPSLERTVEQMPGRADKGLALALLHGAGLLTDEQSAVFVDLVRVRIIGPVAVVIQIPEANISAGRDRHGYTPRAVVRFS
jgi:hypothetical protein